MPTQLNVNCPHCGVLIRENESPILDRVRCPFCRQSFPIASLQRADCVPGIDSDPHAADTFAFATAVERHLGWRYAVPAYTFASYVAISRLPANRHWFSDTVFGAAVGIIAGRTVTSREATPFPVAVSYIPGGIAVMYVRRSQ